MRVKVNLVTPGGEFFLFWVREFTGNGPPKFCSTPARNSIPVRELTARKLYQGVFRLYHCRYPGILDVDVEEIVGRVRSIPSCQRGAS